MLDESNYFMSVFVDSSSFERVEELKYLGRALNKPKFYSGRN
jgi:hypothetical protein